jgi:hypothetical protein
MAPKTTMNQELPEGLDEEKIQRIIEKYDRAASGHLLVSYARWRKRSDYAFVEVPKELLPTVRKLIANCEAARESNA